MALGGSFLDANTGYPNIRNWGSGSRTIHASRANGVGRNTAPDGTDVIINPDLVGDFAPDDYDMLGDDDVNPLWGNNVQTGLADRPAYDPSGDGDMQIRQSVSKDFPSYGPRRGGLPGGMFIRSRDHGAALGLSARVSPVESAANGWENKLTGDVEDSVTSDPSQYEMQTSMTQRDKTRAGSQASGTASEYSQPIRSRIVGQRLRVYADQTRHEAMEPKSQDLIIRPMWNRTAGTGRKQEMTVNEMYVSKPIDRQAPDNPYVGPQTPDDTNGIGEYGYVAEDQTW